MDELREKPWSEHIARLMAALLFTLSMKFTFYFSGHLALPTWDWLLAFLHFVNKLKFSPCLSTCYSQLVTIGQKLQGSSMPVYLVFFGKDFETPMNQDKYLLDISQSYLLTIDVQARLMPTMQDNERVVKRCYRLAEAAKLFELPGSYTEQYPKGLGETLPEVKASLEEAGHPVFDKTRFTAAIPEVLKHLKESGRQQVILCGAETHVCVYQTVRDLLGEGYQVLVAADAVSSRFPDDKALALENFRAMGALVTTSENILFDWLKDAKAPQFKAISNLVKNY